MHYEIIFYYNVMRNNYQEIFTLQKLQNTKYNYKYCTFQIEQRDKGELFFKI